MKQICGVVATRIPFLLTLKPSSARKTWSTLFSFRLDEGARNTCRTIVASRFRETGDLKANRRNSAFKGCKSSCPNLFVSVDYPAALREAKFEKTGC